MSKMKHGFLLVVVIVLCISCSQSEEKKQAVNEIITAPAVNHVANRQDPAKWDTAMFRSDMENRMDMDLPFTSGVFPVPRYELHGEGSFKGLGNFGYPGGEGMEIKLDDKTLLFNSFFVKRNAINEAYIKDDKEDEVFFHIIVLTDFVDIVNYSHVLSEVVSRNHPDYIGQGFYKTTNNRIDYSAFITGDRNAYAIVDMRLFDLTKGKTILIAPQKDKSLRSMQIDSPPMSSKEIEAYTKALVVRKGVKEFFVGEGSI